MFFYYCKKLFGKVRGILLILLIDFACFRPRKRAYNL